jgi:hypothetical protein
MSRNNLPDIDHLGLEKIRPANEKGGKTIPGALPTPL